MSTFQRRHYEAVAASINSVVQEEAMQDVHLSAIKVVAQRLARKFDIDNPNFNRSRFMEACGF